MDDKWLFAGNIADQVDPGGPEVGVPRAKSAFWGFWGIHGEIGQLIAVLIFARDKKKTVD